MTAFANDHNDTLRGISDWAIRRSVDSLVADDQLTVAMREAIRNGVSINDISEMTGLTPEAIRRRVNGNLNVLDDLAMLA